MPPADRVETQSGPRVAILYDCVYPFVPGGGQKRLYEIFRRLVLKGWQVDWYGLQSWPGPGVAQVDGIRFIPVAAAVPMYGPNGKRLISQALYYGRKIAGSGALRHYDLIHLGQWPYFHFFPALLWSKLGGARLSVDWWEVWGSSWRRNYGKKGIAGAALERVCARIPSKVVAISETGAQQLRGIGVPRHRIRVVHNGINWVGSARPRGQRIPRT